MLKRENDTEKNKKIEEFKSKYNIDELFENIITKEKECNNSQNKN